MSNIQDLEAMAVASGIFQITTAAATFSHLVNALGTSMDTVHLRNKLLKTRLHIGQLVKDTAAVLKRGGEADGSSEFKKSAYSKLAQDFHTTLKEFQKANKLAIERETMFGPLISKHSNTVDETETSSSTIPEQESLLPKSKRPEIWLSPDKITLNKSTSEQNKPEIEDIMQQIDEINLIFKDLAVLVRESAWSDDIDNSVTDAIMQATSQTQILTANRSSSLVCFLVMTVVILLIVIIIILIIKI